MFKLIKNADVYAPEHLGKRDLFIAGETILHVEPDLSRFESVPDVEVIDLSGKTLVPGFIDLHVHVTGGGGELGPTSRVPEMPVGVLVESGVTTVLGLLGTDGESRTVENLLFKSRALQQEGITAVMLTGSYRYPTVTMTGDVIRDMSLVPECVGAKLALSDHRASGITVDELVRLACDVRMGGLICGKAGVLVIHMGAHPHGLAHIHEALERSELPVSTILPTHINRNDV